VRLAATSQRQGREQWDEAGAPQAAGGQLPPYSPQRTSHVCGEAPGGTVSAARLAVSRPGLGRRLAGVSTRARISHGAAAWGDAPSSSRCGPRRALGKQRGGEDVRWRACVAVWGAK
jgi:hypothetical protein